MVADDGVVAARKGFSGGWSVVAKPCDYCKTAAALLFCRADLAFLCAACDAKVHDSSNKMASRHERVWLCEVCEQAPASVTCKADAAALCVTCDRDIHSANPLARRHERIPVVPFYDTVESVVKSTASTLLAPSNQVANNDLAFEALDTKIVSGPGNGNFSTDSWFSSDPINSSKYTTENPDLKSSMEFLLSDSDQFLDFDYPVPKDNYYNPCTDSVVPVQTMKPPSMPTRLVVDHHSSDNRFEIDFTRTSIKSYNNNNSYSALSLNHSVSSSSMDIGIVPDGSSFSETSYPFGGSSVDVSTTANGNQAVPIVGKEREARVLRYREKRKNRKFEKTIRYASRKAYAETRPRVKGRFAKRSSTDVECEIDQIFINSGFDFSDARFGIVPSFG